MSLQIAEARAPFVMFETRAVEDRAATLSNGRYTTRDVDYVLITPAGSKDQIERVVEEWFAQLERDAKNGRYNPEWLNRYKAGYREWKAGNELPLDGTPIKTWTVISPAQRANLITWKVMTVEDLAACNEDVIMRLGMGGRTLKKLAQDWLTSAKDVGQVALQLNSLQQQNEDLRAQIANLQAKNTQLEAMLPTQQRPGGHDEDDDGLGGDFKKL